MELITFIPVVVVAIAGGIAAVTDVWKYKVHNWLTLPLFVSGLLFHFAVNGWRGLGFSLGGAIFGFTVLIVCYVLGGVGAGDVKLMAGVGAWLGLLNTSQVFLVAGVAAGIWSVVAITAAGGMRRLTTNCLVMCYQLRSLAFHFGTGERVEQVVSHHDRRKRLVPLAAMISVGIFAFIVAETVFGVTLFGSAFDR